MTNWMLVKYGYTYVGKLPQLAHQYIDGTITPDNLAVLKELQVVQHSTTDLMTFSQDYIARLSEAYNYGFGVACISLIISVLIYASFRSSFKHVEGSQKAMAAAATKTEAPVQELSAQETKDRVIALVLVFAVVIFFWMAFHQNGLTMTFFARDYTASSTEGLTRLGFNVFNLALIAGFIYAAFAVFQSATTKAKTIAAAVAVGCLAIVGVNYLALGNDPVNFLPSDFQQFNPFFVVALTPFSLAIFGALAKAGKEPSAPRKIGIGMFIASLGFLILAVGSMGLPTPTDLKADASLLTDPVSPNWLISTYFVLTFAELLLSPMGISFVSKVAPPKLKGMMMGGWFAATAIGNYLVSIIGYLWGDLPLWSLWAILILLCLLSFIFIFSQMKKLEKVA